jgi:hypothetical protein
VLSIEKRSNKDAAALGTTALGALGYQVDPVTKQLKPVELLML